MKINVVKKYEAGYSKSDLIKKYAAIAAASAVICGGLTSCNAIQGGSEAIELDGDTEIVSENIEPNEGLEYMGEESYQVDDNYNESTTIEGSVGCVSSCESNSR